MSDTNPTPTSEASTPVPTSNPVVVIPTVVVVQDFKTTGSTTATDLRRELSDVLKFVESDGLKTVAITRHGKVVAAVVGGTEFKLLQRLKESAKSLAPKLGLSVEPFLDKLATTEHQIGYVDSGPTSSKVIVTAENPSVDAAVGGPIGESPKLEVLGDSPDAVPTFEN